MIALTLTFGLQSIVGSRVGRSCWSRTTGAGDFVDMEKATGVVEAIGLRVTELRDRDGTVWYVRNGEIVRVGNYSQGGPGEPPAEVEPAETT